MEPAAPPDPAASSGAPLGWPLVDRRRYGDADTALPEGGERRREHPAMVAAPTARRYRWAALAWSLVLAVVVTTTAWWLRVVGLVVFAAVVVYRHRRPIDYTAERQATVGVLSELGVAVAVSAVSGNWRSPFVPWIVMACLQAGFAKGSRWGLKAATASVVIISLASLLDAETTRIGFAFGLSFAMTAVGAALVGGQTRRLGRESAVQQTIALNRLSQLAEANQLLASLHRVAQTLPASLDLNEVLDSTMTRVRDLIGFDSAVLFLWDESEQLWLPARREGSIRQGPIATEQLPAPLRLATGATSTVSQPDLATRGPGLDPGSGAGLYAPLRARGTLVGLIAVESSRTGAFDARAVSLMNGLIEPLALAIDNARFFARLRTISADEERTRIARDLHDRVGQSLAYLGFALDGAVRAAERGEPVGERLETLRSEVRTLTRQVRETLYDLRADVSDRNDLGQIMGEFCDRVRERSGMAVELTVQDDGRLPLPQEREMWRIAKEAMINAEKHAEATTLAVGWWSDGRHARLTVADDGVGLDRTTARSDSYGMLGMRERAASIGAHLELESEPGGGTAVRVSLDPRLDPPPLDAGDPT